jgi:hypothetical protein
MSALGVTQVWRQSTLGPARQIGDLEDSFAEGPDQLYHNDMSSAARSQLPIRGAAVHSELDPVHVQHLLNNTVMRTSTG